MKQHIRTSVGVLVIAGVAFSGVPALAQEGTPDSSVYAEKSEVRPLPPDTRPVLQEKREKREERRQEMSDTVLEARDISEEKREEVRQSLSEKRALIEEKGEERREEVRVKLLEKRGEMKERMDERFLRMKESTTTPAVSLEELRNKRDARRAELAREEASTTPKFRDTMKNANEVRLAVHTLLASKDLLGGVGPRVSEIAKRMNDTVASTTNAEAEIKSRGLLKKLFFGGDETAAEAIKDAVEESSKDIEELKTLLADTTISAEVRAELTAQLATLEKTQDRLTALAEKEGKRWGFFSWRLRGVATTTPVSAE